MPFTARLHPRTWITPALAGVISLFSLQASALQQPDGTVIPVGGALAGYLNAEGESINPLTDAATTPQTFTPQCSLTFTVLARGGGQKNSFGWYNVTGSKPAPQDLYEFIGCNDGVGTVKTLDVRADSRWANGDIGFFQATTEGKSGNCADWGNIAGTIGYFFYSEDRYNDDNVPGNPSNWIHLLIMNTTQPALEPSFYFGWEDLFAGGDNDFEDLLMRVDGIRCAGGGRPCETGALGKCAFGTTQCVNGSVECLANEQASAETCNAVDDDCNGEIDEGDLCDPGLVCDRGVCRPSCSGGEFKCRTGFACENGLCIDTACVGKTCDSGQVCVGGECKAACDGVVCPHGQLCRQDVCVDPCAGVQCDNDYYCEPRVGVCVLKCGCTGCGTGEACSTITAACVQDGCQSVTCDVATHCEGGVCVDNCQGATCPAGQLCQAGACVPDESASGGAGGASGSGGSLSFGGQSFGGYGGSAGGIAGAAGSGGGSLPLGGRSGTSAAEGSGCGCSTPGTGRGQLRAVALLALLGWATRRRRAPAPRGAG